MRNHTEKARDMARSVLPSTARKGARDTRADIRGRERVRERQMLHHLRGYVDPDDFEGVLGEELHREIGEMVWHRRSADKVAPLMRWAERTVARDPRLAAAPRTVRSTSGACSPRGVSATTPCPTWTGCSTTVRVPGSSVPAPPGPSPSPASSRTSWPPGATATSTAASASRSRRASCAP